MSSTPSPSRDHIAVERSKILCTVAGMVGAAISLAVGELGAGLFDRTPSLVLAVGDLVVDRAPTDAVRFGIDAFGRSDKPALLVGIVVVTLLLGGLAAAATRRGDERPLLAMCVLLTVVGVVTSLRFPQTRPAGAVLLPVVAGALGWLTATRLVHLVPERTRPGAAVAVTTPAFVGVSASPTDPPHSRRAFLGWAAAGTGLATTTALGGSVLQRQSTSAAARRAVVLPGASVVAGAGPVPFDGIAGLSPYLVPNNDFYRIDTALLLPRVDPANWRLRVHGLVERPFELSFDALLALPLVETDVTLSCVSNRVGGELVGNARWRGVPLASLLERAGVRPEGTQVVGRSVDGWTAGFPTAAALDGRTALIAVGMNGEPLPTRHGFPARLVVAGLYGYVSATKWLSEIELVPWDSFDGYWVPRGWSKEGPIKTQSRIDVPAEDSTVEAGALTIAGVAWAPNRGIRRVEVQVDDGAWSEADLSTVVSDDTWVQWQMPWSASVGRHRLRVRATDGDGLTQTDERTDPAPNGASGWHTVAVGVR